jgi:hypothetical protein
MENEKINTINLLPAKAGLAPLQGESGVKCRMQNVECKNARRKAFLRFLHNTIRQGGFITAFFDC